MDISKYQKIASYIDLNPVAVLGTIDNDGTPYGAVVDAYTDEHQPIIYFVTKDGTRKYKNLLARPVVSLTVVNPKDVSTLQAKGRASTIRDLDTLDLINTRITRVLTATPVRLPPLAKIHAGEYAMVAVQLTEARLSEYNGLQVDETGIFSEA